jgi:hypothetical protein
VNPEPEQHVKLYFHNGGIEEGVVVSWSDQKSVLRSLTSPNLLIIQDTIRSVLAVKIFLEESFQESPKKFLATRAGEAQNQVYVDRELELEEPERDLKLRALKLAQLRILRGQEERELARRAMTTFKQSDANVENVYGTITQYRPKPPDQYTEEED